MTHLLTHFLRFITNKENDFIFTLYWNNRRRNSVSQLKNFYNKQKSHRTSSSFKFFKSIVLCRKLHMFCSHFSFQMLHCYLNATTTKQKSFNRKKNTRERNSKVSRIISFFNLFHSRNVYLLSVVCNMMK